MIPLLLLAVLFFQGATSVVVSVPEELVPLNETFHLFSSEAFQKSCSCENFQKSKYAIVGGGVGGISAAIPLLKMGHEVHIFEASGDVGGRLLSYNLPDGTVIELGAMRIPGSHKALKSLAAFANLNEKFEKFQEVGGEQVFFVEWHGEIHNRNDLNNNISLILDYNFCIEDNLETISVLSKGYGCPPGMQWLKFDNISSIIFEEELVKQRETKPNFWLDMEHSKLADTSIYDFMKEQLKKKMDEKYVQIILEPFALLNMMSCYPHISTVEALRDELDINSASDFVRLPQGHQQLVKSPLEKLKHDYPNTFKLRTNHRVTLIEVKDGSHQKYAENIEINGSNFTFDGYNGVLLAIPQPAATSIEIKPPLKDIREASLKLSYDQAVKVVAVLEKEKLPKELIEKHANTYIDTTMTSRRIYLMNGTDYFLAMSYTWGRDSQRWISYEGQRSWQVVEDLSKILGEEVKKAYNETLSREKIWSSAFVLAGPGEYRNYALPLYFNVNDRSIHVAGEHLHLEEHAWINSSIESALQRACLMNKASCSANP